jgi:hypothetical protein
VTLSLLCMDPSHAPLLIAEFGDGTVPWTPARRCTPALEFRCPLCGGGPWRFGARRMRVLTDAATKGEVSGAVDISKLT